MSRLTLDQASVIADAALAEGARRNLAPLAIVVLDAGSHALVTKRHEDAGLYRTTIATAKAAGCLGMGYGGRELARRAAAVPALYAAVNAVTDQGLVALPGGVLIRDAEGVVIGAAGCSGDTADQDEACLLAGIAAAGLVAETGAA